MLQTQWHVSMIPCKLCTLCFFTSTDCDAPSWACSHRSASTQGVHDDWPSIAMCNCTT